MNTDAKTRDQSQRIVSSDEHDADDPTRTINIEELRALQDADQVRAVSEVLHGMNHDDDGFIRDQERLVLPDTVGTEVSKLVERCDKGDKSDEGFHPAEPGAFRMSGSDPVKKRETSASTSHSSGVPLSQKAVSKTNSERRIYGNVPKESTGGNAFPPSQLAKGVRLSTSIVSKSISVNKSEDVVGRVRTGHRPSGRDRTGRDCVYESDDSSGSVDDGAWDEGDSSNDASSDEHSDTPDLPAKGLARSRTIPWVSTPTVRSSSVPGAVSIGGRGDFSADDAFHSSEITTTAVDVDALGPSSIDVVARAQLVDEPIVAAEVGEDRTDELIQEALKQERGNKRKQMRIAIGIGLLIIVAVVILVAVLAPRRGSGGATSSPTPAPTPAPTTQLAASWIELIQSRMPSTTFEDTNSPQRQALDWMSEDEYTIALVDDDLIVQRFALAVLYYAANGTNWDSHTAGWLNSSSECVWGEPDLDCTEDGVVLEVGLRSDGLSGRLPKEIGLLSTVEWMNIHSNDLAGPIPSEIGQMNSLTHLDIRQSGLVGTIPTELGSLAALEFLNLRINRLEGTIPTELGKLTVLSRLNLSDNNLSGTIPPVVIVPSLQWVSFKINFDLTGMLPTELGLCNLTVLLVEQTELTGTIAPHLCNTLVETQIDCGEIECDCCLGWNETQNDTHYVWC